MKMIRLYTLIFAVLSIPAILMAQSPEKMSYQAVIRNANGDIVTTQVGMKLSLLIGSNAATATEVYSEILTPTPNSNGLVSIEFGGQAGWDAIDWSSGKFFIKTETDPSGGTDYTIAGVSQLLSVPYALHAKSAETLTGNITESQISDLGTYIETESDPEYNASVASGITQADTAKWNAASVGDFTESDPVFTAWDKDYTDLTNTPVIPTSISELTNDEGYITGYTETDPSVPAGTQTGQMQYWNGTTWITVAAGSEGQMLSFSGGVPTWKTLIGVIAVGPTDVYNPVTGEVWMDRNLGASQVATSSNDADAYGDLYQWGRAADGHESRTSGTTETLSSTDTPGHGDLIIASTTPFDWRNPQNINLWQGVSGTNNPCPGGYRLPTQAEWEAERESWSSNNAEGAFTSPLKLPMAGLRLIGGLLDGEGFNGRYWSSTTSSFFSQSLTFSISIANMQSAGRSLAASVRCIKD